MVWLFDWMGVRWFMLFGVVCGLRVLGGGVELVWVVVRGRVLACRSDFWLGFGWEVGLFGDFD